MWYPYLSNTNTHTHIHTKRHEIEPHIRNECTRTPIEQSERRKKNIQNIRIILKCLVGICAALTLFIGHSQHNIISRRCEREEVVRDEKKNTAGIKRNYRQSEQQRQQQHQQNPQKQSQNGYRVPRKNFRQRRIFGAIVLGFEQITPIGAILHSGLNCRMEYFVSDVTSLAPCAHTNMNGVFSSSSRSFVRSLHLYNGNMYRGEHETLVRQSR